MTIFKKVTFITWITKYNQVLTIKVKIIKDAVHGDIECSELEIKLIDTPQFQRLRNIRQLGLSDLIYPSATHTRYQHSLGVMHLGGRLGRALDLDIEDTKHLRIAGLLHDIGHLPYSHTLERVLSERGLDHEKNATIIIEEDMKDLLEDNGIDSKTINDAILGKGRLGKMMSSGVDIDKLDYLSRDSYFTGVAYGVIDMSRVLHIASIDNDIFAFEKKGIKTIESVVLARFMMFSAVYEYKAKKAAERMLFRALDAMDRRSLNSRKLLSIDEADFQSILRSQEGYTKDIIGRIDHRDLFKRAGSMTKDELTADQLSRCLDIKDSCATQKRIEDSMARKLGIPEGYLITDIRPRPKGIEDIMLIGSDRKYNKLRDVSAMSRSLMRQRWHDWEVSFYCPKEYRKKVSPKVKDLFMQSLE